MHPLIRALIALPIFYAYGAGAFFVGGSDGLGGVALFAVGAVAAGYIVGAPWAFLLAAPIVAYGVITTGSPGPLENTDSGWGLIVLLVLGLPIVATLAAGAAARWLTNRSQDRWSKPPLGWKERAR